MNNTALSISFLFMLAGCLLLSFAGCQNKKDQLLTDMHNIDFIWTQDSIRREDGDRSFISLEIKNNTGQSLNQDNWSIHYNHINGGIDPSTISAEISITNQGGDYFVLKPTEQWPSLASGQSRKYNFQIRGILRRASEAPQGVFAVVGAEAKSINAQTIGIDEKTLASYGVPNNESRFLKNERLQKLDKESFTPIIPAPAFTQPGSGSLVLQVPIRLYHPEAQSSAAKSFMTRMNQAGIAVNSAASPGEAQIILEQATGNGSVPESYQMIISGKDIHINGSDEAGLFYGIQSLSQLIMDQGESEGSIELRQLEIRDQPRFGYRGLHLDVSRNFHSKEKVLEMLDLMSFYKLNVFQFHLTDDEGWRLEIPGLPELTTIGARRGFTVDEREHLFPSYGSGPDPDNSSGSGYYTRQDYIDILKYAQERHIEVIPEIDVPGHSRAAIKAMYSRYLDLQAQGHNEAAEEYLLHDQGDESVYRSAQNYSDNVLSLCQPGTYRFIEKLVEELVQMHKDAGVPLKVLHAGGDEVPYGAWQNSPKCREYLVNNPHIKGSDELHAVFMSWLKDLLNEYDVVTAGWEEIVLLHGKDGHNTIEINPAFIEDQVRAYVWNATMGGGREDMTYKLANMGYPVVMCNSSAFYLDMADDLDPDNIGLNWSGYSDTERAFSVEPLNIYLRETKTSWGTDLDPGYLNDRVRITNKGLQKFLGIQAQIWSETLNSAEKLDKISYPKLLGFAERAWSPEPVWVREEDEARLEVLYQKEWQLFANKMGQSALPVLDKYFPEVLYNIPKCGVIKRGDSIHVNNPYPGLTIRYTTNGKDPDNSSPEYKGPIKDDLKEYRFAVVGASGRVGKSIPFKS